MNDQSHDFAAQMPASAFRFTGGWREYLPIALTNLLLTLVTLGIYRFWAKARERRYLWSRTEFIDDQLEWTGTGGEMFKGFLVVMVILIPAVLALQFGTQALILRGMVGLAGAVTLLLYLGILGLTGVARYRALRYRLSRTYWHGIRGGGEPGGWGYGFSYLWKTIAGTMAAGLLVPWSMTALWNERWSAMSFGPHRFQAYSNTEGLMGRWVLVLISPFVLLLVGAGLAVGAVGGIADRSTPPGAAIGAAFAFILAVYGIIALIGVGYFAAYLRKVISTLELGDVRFEFTASSADWLKLFLGHAAIVVLTLGFGLMFISYRNWSFFIRHLEALGEIDLDTFTQSTSDASGDAEGLAAAFDIGAI